MARIRQANVHGTLNGAITSGATSITVAYDATSAALQALGTLDILVVVLEPDTANEEVIYVQGAQSGGATTWSSVLRGQEGVSAGIAHSSGVAWKHGPTVVDVTMLAPAVPCTVANGTTFDLPANTQAFARNIVIGASGEITIPATSELMLV